MLKKIAPDVKSVGKSMELSMSYITDAEKNMSMDCYRMVMISGYTAMFHAGRAILFRDGVNRKKAGRVLEGRTWEEMPTA